MDRQKENQRNGIIMIKMKDKIQYPDWVFSDLQKSGLTPENFEIEPAKNEVELIERLGFSSIKDNSGNEIKLSEHSGYWIPYPNAPGYYRLKLQTPIETEDGSAKYLSPKKEMGFGNRAFVPSDVEKLLDNHNPDRPIFITEGEKKAVKATLEGFPCIGLSGVWNFTDSGIGFLVELEGCVWKNRTVYIVFDSDITEKHGVRHAEVRLAIELLNRGAKVLSVRLPGESSGEKNGFDDYLVRHGREAFEEIVKRAQSTIELHIIEGMDTNLILQETTRLNNEIVREKIIKAIAEKEDVGKVVVLAQYRKYKAKEAEQPPREEFSRVQLKQAEILLRSPGILSSMTEFTKKLGFTGEEDNQQLIYLGFTSRKMNDSISIIVKGSSASGKSHLTGTVLRLFPESDVLDFSFITPKALVYRNENLDHKILYIAEHSGSEGADYSIRTLLSERELSIMCTVKNEATGKFETIEKKITAKGLVFVETTTRDRVHAENQTRVFDLYIDDSETQTGNILRMQARQMETNNPGIENEIKIWRAAQSLLKGYSVDVPYAQELAEAFPKKKIRARRDFPRLLSLIRTHTLLYQFQREKDRNGRLIATVEDFESIFQLAEPVLSQSMKGLSPKQEQAIFKLRKEFSDREFSIKEAHNEVQELAGYSTLQGWFKRFVEDGIMEWNGGKGTASRFAFLSPGRSLDNARIFSSNFLESLKNNYLKPETGNIGRSGNLSYEPAQSPDNLELPGIENEAINTNNKSEVQEIKALTQLPMSVPHEDRLCSTDPEDWESKSKKS